MSFNFELIGNPVPAPPPAQHVYWAEWNEGELTIAWGDPTFVLEAAPTVNGPWSTIATQSPATISINPALGQRFYRLRMP